MVVSSVELSILPGGENDPFLTNQAVKEHVAASTQNQALSSILYLYQHALEQPLDRIEGVIRAGKPKRRAVVLSQQEVEQVFPYIPHDKWLIVMLLYGAGLRLLEALRLRVKDIDFSANQITVREGKGNKDRGTMLPQVVRQRLEQHLQQVRHIHEHDLADGYGRTTLPHALSRK